MKYTMKDIRASLPSQKAQIEPFWCRIFVRPTSYYFTYYFINFHHWTPNYVSILSCFWAILATVFMFIDNIGCIWIGAIMFNLWSVLDCVDGNMARCTKRTSKVGEFFDAMGGYTIAGFSMLGFGMAAYHTTTIFGEYSFWLILLGGVGGLTDISSRLIYQKYSNNYMIMEANRVGIGALHTENEAFYSGKGEISKFKKLVSFIDYEFGTGGDELLFLLIALAIGYLDLLTLAYAIYHILGFIAVAYMYSKKMLKYEKEHLYKEN